MRRAVLSMLALFTGAALVVHLTIGISLAAALAVLGIAVTCASAAVWTGASPQERDALLARICVGVVAGVVATLGYDLTKLVAARLIGSHRNPFETVRLFGILLAGHGAPSAVTDAAGVAFHVANGGAFGVAYSILFGRRGALAGTAWGITLEMMQLLLYPRWLHLDVLKEFTVVSLAGHTAYGLILGSLCRIGSAHTRRERRAVSPRMA